jgi:cytochrome o ubiquinol oxidase subunit 1
MMKHEKLAVAHERTVEIEMPKNTPLGLFVGVLSLLFGFGVVWHIWWLAALGLVGIVVLLVARSFTYEGND